MSNFIPMVSSSPPPLEDSGGFDDWGDDDDDFGTFTGANNNSDFTPFQSDNSAQPNVWNNKTSDSAEVQFGNFADFGKLSSSTENITDTAILQNDVDLKNKPLSLNLEKSENFQSNPNVEKDNTDASNENVKNVKECEFKDEIESENTFNIMRNTTRDSGIFSTDISPSLASDTKPSLQNKFKGSEDNLYDSPSEDSTSKDLSDSTSKDLSDSTSKDLSDLTSKDLSDSTSKDLSDSTSKDLSETQDLDYHMDDKNVNEMNKSYMSETADCNTDSQLKDDKNNEKDSIKQGIPGCDKEIPDSNSESDSELSDNVANINRFVSGDTSEIPQSDQEITTSLSQKSLNDPIKDGFNDEKSDIAAVNKLVQNDSIKEALTNPPLSSICDHLTSVEDSPVSLTQSDRDSESSVLANLSSVKDSGIEMCDSVIENGVIDTEENNISSSDNCPDEYKENLNSQKNDINDESSPCFEEEVTDEENSGSADSDQHSKNSSENIDDATNCEQSEESSYNQPNLSDSEKVKDVTIENETESGIVFTSQSDSLEKLDSLSDKSKTSVQETIEDVDSDLNVIKGSSYDESGSSENVFEGYNTSENLNLKVGVEDDDDEDFDDFADFQTVTEFTTSEITKTVTDLKDESESGWGFQNASAVDEDENDDWANFQEPVISQNTTNDNFGGDNDDDDDFGEFGNFEESTDFNSFAPQTQENFKNTAPVTKSEPPKVELKFRSNLVKRQRKVSESVVDDVVHEMINESDSLMSDMTSELNTVDTCLMSKASAVKANKEQHKDNPELWTKLKNLNSTTAIKYQWPESSVNKKLFSTLKIDTQNILLGHRKQHVPIYASNLTMLEPTKGPIAPKSNSDPQLVDTDQSKSQQLQNINMEIPPVQFDWTTSGLTNPLEENRKTLGLDFLVVNEAEATSRSTVLSGDNGPQEVKTNLQPLENILATLKVSTVKKTKHTENLGQEAAKIITSLPDLSFMQAKVLMFPLRQQNNN